MAARLWCCLSFSTNAVGVALYVSRSKVPKAYWDEVIAAVRDFYHFSNKDDIESCVAGFLELQRKLHGEDDCDSGDGTSKGNGEGGGGPPTRHKAKEGTHRPSENTKVAPAKVSASMFDALANGSGDIDCVMARQEEFTPEARASLEPILSHLISANAFVEAILPKSVIDDGSVASALESAKAISKDEKEQLAPKLYGVFGVDPTVYITLQEIRRQVATTRLQDESQLEAEKEYAMVEPKQNEAFSAFFCRFCEIRRKVGIARNLSTNEALPEQSSVSKLVQSLEQSKIAKFMELGYSLREELTQRSRLDKSFVPTLDDVKVIGESQFKK